MTNDLLEAEKIVRYLIKIGVIHVFSNKEDEIIKHFKELNVYKWSKDSMHKCHLVAAKYCSSKDYHARLLPADKFIYFSYFKWIVLWLKVKQIYKIDEEKVRDDIFEEYLTVKEILKTDNVRRSEHQFANHFTETYHLFAHYTDTRRSLCYQNHFSDLKLDASFLQGPFPRKLKSVSIVERCFSYYLHDLADKLFIKRHAISGLTQRGNREDKEYRLDDIKGFQFRHKNKDLWRVSTMFQRDKP